MQVQVEVNSALFDLFFLISFRCILNSHFFFMITSLQELVLDALLTEQQ